MQLYLKRKLWWILNYLDLKWNLMKYYVQVFLLWMACRLSSLSQKCCSLPLWSRFSNVIFEPEVSIFCPSSTHLFKSIGNLRQNRTKDDFRYFSGLVFHALVIGLVSRKLPFCGFKELTGRKKTNNTPLEGEWTNQPDNDFSCLILFEVTRAYGLMWGMLVSAMDALSLSKGPSMGQTRHWKDIKLIFPLGRSIW